LIAACQNIRILLRRGTGKPGAVGAGSLPPVRMVCGGFLLQIRLTGCWDEIWN
jgi:hypothetical protein